MPTVRVFLDGQDELVFDAPENGKPGRVFINGCQHLMTESQNLKAKHGPDPRNWQLPSGTNHVAILLREFILKAQGKWQYPYQQAELCHCRMIPTQIVDDAIVRGAHTPEKVSEVTSASTACGTCRLDVIKILDYRLGRTGS